MSVCLTEEGAEREGQTGGTAERVRKLRGEGYVHYLDCSMVSPVNTYVKMYQIVCFKYVQSIPCQLYLNHAVY